MLANSLMRLRRSRRAGALGELATPRIVRSGPASTRLRPRVLCEAYVAEQRKTYPTRYEELVWLQGQLTANRRLVLDAR